MLNLRSSKSGFTLVEIMIVVAIIALLAAIAIPNVLRGRTTANEASAIGNMRALVSSLEMYRSVNNAYTKDAAWENNMFPGGGVPGFGPPSFDLAMTGQTIQGYDYTYASVPIGCTDAAQDCSQYTVSAVPQLLNRTGTRSFFVDESASIRHCTGTTAAVTDPTIDAAPIAC